MIENETKVTFNCPNKLLQEIDAITGLQQGLVGNNGTSIVFNLTRKAIIVAALQYYFDNMLDEREIKAKNGI